MTTMAEWMVAKARANGGISMLDSAELFDKLLGQILTAEWVLGFRDRGMGHGDYGILAKVDGEEILVDLGSYQSVTEHLIALHNQSLANAAASGCITPAVKGKKPTRKKRGKK